MPRASSSFLFLFSPRDIAGDQQHARKSSTNIKWSQLIWGRSPPTIGSNFLSMLRYKHTHMLFAQLEAEEPQTKRTRRQINDALKIALDKYFLSDNYVWIRFKLKTGLLCFNKNYPLLNCNWKCTWITRISSFLVWLIENLIWHTT